MGSVTDNELLPTSIQDAMRLFDYRYEASVGQIPSDAWAEEFGDKVTTDTPLVRFPIGLFTGNYTEFKGDIRTDELEDRYADVKTKEYQKGYEVPALDLIQNPIRGRQWAQVPNQFVLAETRFQNALVAAALNGGTSAVNFWDSGYFFATNHPADPQNPDAFTDWSNYQASTIDLTEFVPTESDDIVSEVAIMQQIPGIDGLPLGVDPNVLMVPTAKLEITRLAYAKQYLGSGENNPYYNRFRIVGNPLITSTTAYLIDTKIMGSLSIPPWAIVEYVPPSPLGQALRLRWFDESSDYFKNTSRLKVSSHIHYSAALLFPHAIRRLTIA
jgi:hypothetical protein